MYELDDIVSIDTYDFGNLDAFDFDDLKHTVVKFKDYTLWCSCNGESGTL